MSPNTIREKLEAGDNISFTPTKAVLLLIAADRSMIRSKISVVDDIKTALKIKPTLIRKEINYGPAAKHQKKSNS